MKTTFHKGDVVRHENGTAATIRKVIHDHACTVESTQLPPPHDDIWETCMFTLIRRATEPEFPKELPPLPDAPEGKHWVYWGKVNPPRDEGLFLFVCKFSETHIAWVSNSHGAAMHHINPHTIELVDNEPYSPPTTQKNESDWKIEPRGKPPSLDWVIGNPYDLCVCGHERQQHGSKLGVNWRGSCHSCRIESAEAKPPGELHPCPEFRRAEGQDCLPQINLSSSLPLVGQGLPSSGQFNIGVEDMKERLEEQGREDKEFFRSMTPDEHELVDKFFDQQIEGGLKPGFAPGGIPTPEAIEAAKGKLKDWFGCLQYQANSQPSWHASDERVSASDMDSVVGKLLTRIATLEQQAKVKDEAIRDATSVCDSLMSYDSLNPIGKALADNCRNNISKALTSSDTRWVRAEVANDLRTSLQAMVDHIESPTPFGGAVVEEAKRLLARNANA